MNVKNIMEMALGFDKKSYVTVEHVDGKIQKITLRRDKKRLNQGSLGNQYYFLVDGARIYVNDIHAIQQSLR